MPRRFQLLNSYLELCSPNSELTKLVKVAPCQFVNGRRFWSAIVASFGTSVLLISCIRLKRMVIVKFLSWSSSILSNMSMNSDSNDDELVDQFYVAFHNANAIACDLAQTILHGNIDWRWKCGLSSDHALNFFRFR